MSGRKSTRPKRAGALKKRRKKEPVARATVFTYEHGEETTSMPPSELGKSRAPSRRRAGKPHKTKKGRQSED
jgi:hypothetical protein